MKEILLSVKPEWLAKILNGEKTLEIRKNIPHEEMPCKVWLYCSKGKKNEYLVKTNKGYKVQKNKSGIMLKPLNSKVVGYFILDYARYFEVESSMTLPNLIYEYRDGFLDYKGELQDDNLILKESCLTAEQLEKYLQDKNGDILDKEFYAWVIEDLNILDKPFSLRDDGYLGNQKTNITILKAPQSWCYCKYDKDGWLPF